MRKAAEYEYEYYYLNTELFAHQPAGQRPSGDDDDDDDDDDDPHHQRLTMIKRRLHALSSTRGNRLVKDGGKTFHF